MAKRKQIFSVSEHAGRVYFTNPQRETYEVINIRKGCVEAKCISAPDKSKVGQVLEVLKSREAEV